MVKDIREIIEQVFLANLNFSPLKGEEEMREIKFRAWNSIVMVYQDFPKGGLTAGEILKRFDNVMQFTGLKDKNGKEIYEGDILDTVEGKLEMVYDKEECRFCLSVPQGQFSMLWALGHQTYNNYPVIGNIYENPELLAPKE